MTEENTHQPSEENSTESTKTIGRYVIQSLLGEGAMGSVFKAFDPVIKRVVAIKTIKLDQSSNEEDQKEFIQRFFQEAQISGILNHPNIVSIYDIGQQDGMPYIAMEYVEGRSLNQVIHAESRPETVYLAKVMMQVAYALEFAHSKGIVHRDLKPGNIMVMPNGMAKIMDFGIAKMSGSHLTQTGVFLGTPSFASPEQIKEGHVDHRSDIFSLGILAHETLTGHSPFPGQSISAILYKIANEPPAQAPNLGALPIDTIKWKAVFARVFEKDSGKRYQNAAEFAQDLLGSLKLTNDELAQFGTFMGRISAHVQEAFGIQKDIQRSEFEMAQAPKPPTVRTRVKRGFPTGMLSLLLVVMLVGAGIMAELGQFGESYKVSALWPMVKGLTVKSPRVVTIETDPPGAEVVFDDGTTSRSPAVYTWEFEEDGLEKPALKVEVNAEGHQPETLELAFDAIDKVHKEKVTLIPKSYSRSIVITPKQAQISVDGKALGSGRVEHPFVYGNQYVIRGEAPGYEPAKTVHDETGKPETEGISMSLTKIEPKARLVVRSSMEDLVIKVDGRTSRPPVDLPKGRYRLELRSDRYFFRKSETVTLKAGEERVLETPMILTIPKVETVNIVGCKVKIDGIYVKDKAGAYDTPPLANLKIAAGTHTFAFVDEDGTILLEKTQDVRTDEELYFSLDD